MIRLAGGVPHTDFGKFIGASVENELWGIFGDSGALLDDSKGHGVTVEIQTRPLKFVTFEWLEFGGTSAKRSSHN